MHILPLSEEARITGRGSIRCPSLYIFPRIKKGPPLLNGTYLGTSSMASIAQYGSRGPGHIRVESRKLRERDHFAAGSIESTSMGL